MRTKDNLPLPVQASKEAEATEEFTKISESIIGLDKLHQIAITEKLKELSLLEYNISKTKRYTKFILETTKLFEALIRGFKSRSENFQPLVSDKHQIPKLKKSKMEFKNFTAWLPSIGLVVASFYLILLFTLLQAISTKGEGSYPSRTHFFSK